VRDGEGSKTSGALHEFGTGSYMKSRTLMPSARRTAMQSSAVISAGSISGIISVGAGEGGEGCEGDGRLDGVATVEDSTARS
jgi:hypothetical protein